MWQSGQTNSENFSTQFSTHTPNYKLIGSKPAPSWAKQLKGDTTFRIRVGDYRILYEIDDNSKVVIIYRVKHRREVYR